MPEVKENIIKRAFRKESGAEKLYEEFKHDAQKYDKATITAALLALLIETNKVTVVRDIGKVLAGSKGLYKLKAEK